MLLVRRGTDVGGPAGGGADPDRACHGATLRADGGADDDLDALAQPALQRNPPDPRWARSSRPRSRTGCATRVREAGPMTTGSGRQTQLLRHAEDGFARSNIRTTDEFPRHAEVGFAVALSARSTRGRAAPAAQESGRRHRHTWRPSSAGWVPAGRSGRGARRWTRHPPPSRPRAPCCRPE